MRALEPGTYSSTYTFNGAECNDTITLVPDHEFGDVFHGTGVLSSDGVRMRLSLVLADAAVRGTWAEFMMDGTYKCGGDARFAADATGLCGIWSSTDDNGDFSGAGAWVLNRV